MQFTINFEDDQSALKKEVDAFLKSLSKEQKRENAVKLLLENFSKDVLSDLVAKKDSEQLFDLVKHTLREHFANDEGLLKEDDEKRNAILEKVNEVISQAMQRYFLDEVYATSHRVASEFFKGQKQAILKALENELSVGKGA